MQPFLLLIIAIALSSAACVREHPPKPAEKEPATRTKPMHTPLAERDLAGKPRARPRPTMGALEADSSPSSQPKQKKEERPAKGDAPR